jgi:hypothetical protein
LTVLLLAACVLLCLLALVAHLRPQHPPVVLQPVYARIRVRRVVDRRQSVDLAPLPSRGPPPFSLLRTQTPHDLHRDLDPR